MCFLYLILTGKRTGSIDSRPFTCLPVRVLSVKRWVKLLTSASFSPLQLQQTSRIKPSESDSYFKFVHNADSLSSPPSSPSPPPPSPSSPPSFPTPPQFFSSFSVLRTFSSQHQIANQVAAGVCVCVGGVEASGLTFSIKVFYNSVFNPSNLTPAAVTLTPAGK